MEGFLWAGAAISRVSHGRGGEGGGSRGLAGDTGGGVGPAIDPTPTEPTELNPLGLWAFFVQGAMCFWCGLKNSWNSGARWRPRTNSHQLEDTLPSAAISHGGISEGKRRRPSQSVREVNRRTLAKSGHMYGFGFSWEKKGMWISCSRIFRQASTSGCCGGPFARRTD